MSGENECFCNICSSNKLALADHEISKVGDYLIIQVKRFLVFNQAVTKDITKISCILTLTVPVTLDENVVDQLTIQVIWRSTSGVLHPCPLLSSSWYFAYMCFSINFLGNKSPLMTILDLFRGVPACYPEQQLVW